jgi:hypothetical protein
LNAPVAIGAAGLARHASTVSFQAGSAATIKTSGGAVVRELPSAVHLEGPGRITLHGHFTLRSPSRVQTVSTIILGVAPKDARFSIDLTPEAGGYSIKDGVLQGPIEAT